MAEPGTPPKDVPWSPDDDVSGFQILPSGDLVSRFGDSLWREPERLQFDLVIHCVAGSGTHMVDFEDVPFESGCVLHVRPGQIHQWRADRHGRPGYEAMLVLFRQFRVAPMTHWPSLPTAQALTPEQRERLDLAYSIYGSVTEPRWLRTLTSDRRKLAAGALRDLFQSILDVPSGAEEEDRGRAGPYFELRADVERHLDHGQSVQDRATRLGYSTKTLDRACQAVVGTTAKRLVDQRLALEATRMLVLPGSQASAVARSLGFDEASNFTKFVKRTTGKLPSDWQSSTSSS